ncbi:MAG: hypothetical protein ACR2MB_05285 [Acidimicrobiales bacterium]
MDSTTVVEVGTGGRVTVVDVDGFEVVVVVADPPLVPHAVSPTDKATAIAAVAPAR